MDRSIDSIGSCSLDVDADSSDISDTSGSLNFPTPLSVKDITREFTANIRERCTAHMSNTQTITLAAPNSIDINILDTIQLNESSAEDQHMVNEKKPSYLNLACCVNGYSNLTTYDSKVRQTINKSREVSPIRPSTSSIQYCKKSNALAPPILLTMPNNQLNSSNNSHNNSSQHNGSSNRLLNGHGAHNHDSSLDDSSHHDTSQEDSRSGSSFIQQRVERLYGPGALAQGFYSPKKVRSNFAPRSIKSEEKVTSELSQKFQKLQPGSRDYTDFRNKLNTTSSLTNSSVHNYGSLHSNNNNYSCNNSLGNENGSAVDLPVLRHLSQEFRAQLPTISPKKSITRISPLKECIMLVPCNDVAKYQAEDKHIVISTQPTRCQQPADEVDHKANAVAQLKLQDIPPPPSEACSIKSNKQSSEKNAKTLEEPAAVDSKKLAKYEQIKDGNFFLNLHQSEKERLLSLAEVVEKYTEALSNNPQIAEDTLGMLRSASGKARLFVSQKLKQFEGLCHQNLNRSPEDKFPTTVDDLQGFWDMIYLQVDHIDGLFNEIESLKANNWRALPKNNKMPSKADTTATAAAKPKSSKTAMKPLASKSSLEKSSSKSSAASAAALKRESQRKQLLEMKRKQKIAMAATNSNTTLEIELAPNNVKTQSSKVDGVN